MPPNVPEPGSSEAEIDGLVRAGQLALAAYQPFTQEQIDSIVKKASVAALNQHGALAMLAVEETGRGVFEDKAVKNIFACEHVTHSMADLKTVGVISRDEITGIIEIAEPVGVICGITPVTNPTSTAIFKALIALKTRNPIIFAFHPSAQQCSVAAAGVVRDAAIAAGAPEHCIQWVEKPSIQATNALMNHPGVALILATGGNAMVRGRLLLRQAGPRRRRRQRARVHREDRQAQARGQRRRAVQGLRQRHDLRLRAGRHPRRRDLRRRDGRVRPRCTPTA